MKLRTSSIVLGFLILAAPLHADNAALATLIGTWHCTGITYASPSGPEHPTEATVHGEWILGGSWLQARYEETKTAKNPHPYAAQMLMSVTADKKIVSSCADNTGSWCSQEASGWDHDKLALVGTGHLGATTATMRDTFTRGNGVLKHLGEMQGEKGVWMKLDQETCRK